MHVRTRGEAGVRRRGRAAVASASCVGWEAIPAPPVRPYQ